MIAWSDRHDEGNADGIFVSHVSVPCQPFMSNVFFGILEAQSPSDCGPETWGYIRRSVTAHSRNELRAKIEAMWPSIRELLVPLVKAEKAAQQAWLKYCADRRLLAKEA